MSVNEFVHQELIHFSCSDNVRSIPSVLDGLKPSQRKVLFACFKRNLYTFFVIPTGACRGVEGTMQNSRKKRTPISVFDFSIGRKRQEIRKMFGAAFPSGQMDRGQFHFIAFVRIKTQGDKSPDVVQRSVARCQTAQQQLKFLGKPARVNAYWNAAGRSPSPM